jgi:hypothetical protein
MISRAIAQVRQVLQDEFAARRELIMMPDRVSQLMGFCGATNSSYVSVQPDVTYSNGFWPTMALQVARLQPGKCRCAWARVAGFHPRLGETRLHVGESLRDSHGTKCARAKVQARVASHGCAAPTPRRGDWAPMTAPKRPKVGATRGGVV